MSPPETERGRPQGPGRAVSGSGDESVTGSVFLFLGGRLESHPTGVSRRGSRASRTVRCDVGVGVWGVDHFGLADDDAVGDVVGVGAEEDEVAGLEWLAGRDGRAGVVLLLRGAGELDSGCGVGGLGEAGAVEASWFRSAALVEGADLSERIADRSPGCPAALAAVVAEQLREGDDIVHVGGGVVIVADELRGGVT